MPKDETEEHMQYCFGIDVGGTTIKCGLFNSIGEVLDKWEIPTDRDADGVKIPGDIAASIQLKMAEKNLTGEQLSGVGIGVPGPVLDDGTVLLCPNLGWKKLNIRTIMEQMLGVPVRVGNDANVAALGEQWKGGGRGFSDMMMVTLGTGVGGGLILNKKIVCGSNGAAAELGHIIVNSEETDCCGCGGHGHLEQYASATGIVRMAKKKLASESVISTLHGYENLTAKDIFDEAKKGDSVALELVDMLGKYLAMALSHVAAVVDPVAFVIGGGVSRAGSILIDAIERHYNENLMEMLKGKVFRLAELGNDAGIFGAARMVLGE